MHSLTECACTILLETDAAQKAALSQDLWQRWRDGVVMEVGSADPPVRPNRPDKPELLHPREMPRRRLTSKNGRLAFMHAIAHIELNAIDLVWDLITRFTDSRLPREFYDDWAKVGSDEARHFTTLQKYLEDHGSSYGELAAHDGLWKAAESTSDDILARLAIVPLVLEARGLDTTPVAIQKLKSVGDEIAASILNTIAQEEIAHVAAGVKWFDYICNRRGLNPAQTFQDLVRKRFKGPLKPPFAIEARTAAGFPRAYYEPLATG